MLANRTRQLRHAKHTPRVPQDRMPDRVAFLLVALEQGCVGASRFDQRHLPREVGRVLYPRVHPLAARGAVYVRRVASQHDAPMHVLLYLALIDPEVGTPVGVRDAPARARSRIEQRLQLVVRRVDAIAVAFNRPFIGNHPYPRPARRKRRDHSTIADLEARLVRVDLCIHPHIREDPTSVDRFPGKRNPQLVSRGRVGTVASDQPRKPRATLAFRPLEHASHSLRVLLRAQKFRPPRYVNPLLLERFGEDALGLGLRDEDSGWDRPRLVFERDGSDQLAPREEPCSLPLEPCFGESLERDRRVEHGQRATPDDECLGGRRRTGGGIDDAYGRTVSRQSVRGRQPDRAGAYDQDGLARHAGAMVTTKAERANRGKKGASSDQPRRPSFESRSSARLGS